MASLFLTALALLGYHEVASLFDPLTDMLGIDLLRAGGARPEWAFFAELSAIACVGFFLAFFLPLLNPRLGLLMVILMACALGSAAFSLQPEMGGVKFGYPMLLLLLGYLSSLLLRRRGAAAPASAVRAAEPADAAPVSPDTLTLVQPVPDAPVSDEPPPAAAEGAGLAPVASAEPELRVAPDHTVEAPDAVVLREELLVAAKVRPDEPATEAPVSDEPPPAAAEGAGLAPVASAEPELRVAPDHTVEAPDAVVLREEPLGDGTVLADKPVPEVTLTQGLQPETPRIKRLGSFELEPNPVAGPFGSIYKGRNDRGHAAMVHTITLALIPRHERDAFRKRMQMHAEMLGRLSHRRIARVLESGEDADMAYIAYESAEGTLLSEYCKKGTLLSLQDALALIAKLAEAIDIAHKNGLIHQALRPGTIVLTPDGEVVMTEFSLAAIVGGSGDSLPVEILPYTAPEVVFGRRADGRADLFSLGAVLYEMLSGERLFSGERSADIFYQITTKPHRQIGDMRPDMPVFCDMLLDRLLSKSREQRYQLSIDLSDDIAMVLFNL